MADQPSEKSPPTSSQEEPTTRQTDEVTGRQTDDANDEATAEESESAGEQPPGQHSLGRRSFLKTAAATAAVGALGAAGVSGNAAAAVDIVDLGADPNGGEPIDAVLEDAVSDGTVVEFPSDGEFVISGANLNADNFELRGNGATLVTDGGLLNVSGSGWRIDGFEIDQRSNPGYGRLSVSGGDYEVSRCIWRGQAGTAEDWAVFVRANSGTSARFTDCYWPDGAVDGGEESNHGCIGSFQDYTSGATLVFERCWFHGWSEDTVYASKPDVDLRLIDCYFHNTISGPRVSNVTMRGCTSVSDGAIPIEAWSGSAFQSGVWLNGEKDTPGEPLIEDCDFYMTGPDATHPIKGNTLPGPLTVRDTRIHNETGKAAIWADGDESEFLNVTVSGNNTDVAADGATTTDVTTVDGEAADPSPPIPEPPAEGSIPGGSGSDGGSTSTPTSTDTTDSGGDSGNGTGGEWSTIRIEGDGDSSTQALFEFEVSGELESLTPTEGTRQEGHGVDGSYVLEDAWAGYEEYEYTGEVVSFELDGPGTVYRNGTEVTPEELVSSAPALPNAIVFEAGADEATDYSFSVTEAVEADESTAALEDEDTVSGTDVDGRVEDDTDAYRFAGTLENLQLSGSARIDITQG